MAKISSIAERIAKLEEVLNDLELSGSSDLAINNTRKLISILKTKHGIGKLKSKVKKDKKNKK